MSQGENNFMTRLAAFIVDRRRWILALFAALLAFSAFSVRWIRVQEDITWYLPEDAEARQGLFLMEEEFTTYATARIMVRSVSPEDARELSERMADTEDVVLVRWDDTAAHYREGNALYDLTFADAADSARSEAALERVRQLIADRDAAIYSEVGFSLSELVADQMLTVLIFVVIVVLAVLVFTSSTYAEIPVMILTFLTAAVINIGTHFLMGTISFVSNSVAIVLQLALSVDYAIILCNRYKEEHERLGIRDAAVRALAVSIPEIAASSLTTIAGLTAMTLMKFRLGADMGLTLIKAIVCSLLTVFLFMPALLMLFGKAMDRTRHRRFVPKIPFAGRFAYATRKVVPVLLVALVVFGYVMVSRVSYAYNMELVPAFRQTEMEEARQEISDVFGPENTVALIVPSGDPAAEKALLEELTACSEVKSATGLASIPAMNGYTLGDTVDAREFASLAGIDDTQSRALLAWYAAETGEHREVSEDPSAYRATVLDLFLFLHDRLEAGDVEVDEAQAATVRELYTQLDMVRQQLTGERHSRMILDLDLPVQSEETFRFLDTIHAMAARYYPDGAVLTGEAVSAMGFRDSFASDNTVVGLMSLGLVMLILFFTFRSFGMPLLLILVIQGSIWLNFAVAALKGDYVFFLCYIIVGAIQMGANIDYAIVVSSRYRELRQTMEQKEAVIETLNLAFPTVITSGLMMVCSGLLIGFGVSQCIIAGMGYYVGTGTSISLVLILFALPQLLLLGEQFVTATTLRAGRSHLLLGLRRRALPVTAALLAACCLFAAVASPLSMGREEEKALARRAAAEELLRRTADLRNLADKLESEGEELDTLKYEFARQLVTEQVGSQQLAEGEKQLAEGEEQYESGLAQYEAGEARLDEAQAEYDEGAAQLRAAQAQYDAGLAAYNEGKAAYEAAERELADAQAQYDEGLVAYEAGQQAWEEGQAELAAGQEAYDRGLAQYTMAKAALDALQPLYEAAMNLEQQVEQLQQAYDEAVAQGDYLRAAILAGQLAAARAALEGQLGDLTLASLLQRYEEAREQLEQAARELAEGKAALDEGYARAAEGERQLNEAREQLEAGKAALDEGYAQLADAKTRLEAAEQELADGRRALDEGYAQLAEGGRQIAEGRTEAASAEQQLRDGREKLDESRKQLEEGRKVLAENLKDLNESLSRLDTYEDERERLARGVLLLQSDGGVHALLGAGAGVRDVLSAAERYGNAALEEEQGTVAIRIAKLGLLLAAACAALGLLLSLRKNASPVPPAVLCAAGSLLSLLALLYCRAMLPEPNALFLAAAAALTVSAALLSELLFRRGRAAS